MPQKILVLSPCSELRRALCDGLLAQHYPVTQGAALDHVSTWEPRPALCMVDLHFSRTAGPQAWEAWLQDCRASHAACLAFDSEQDADRTRVALLEPLSDILLAPLDQTQLTGKVQSLLTIRKLARQLDVTRHQLSRFQEELQEALQSAAHIQRSLIPVRQPTFSRLRFSWQYLPCKQVGGDLFNIVQLDEQTIMTYLVDVSGHGVSSAMVTVSVHQSLSTHTGTLVKKQLEQPPYYDITAPRKVLLELEKEYPFERFEEFFTISYLLVNPHTGLVRYSSAGHPPPLLLRRDGRTERLAAGGTLIGVGEMVDFEEGEVQLEPGDRLYMYTDGITEHCDPHGEPYGEEQFRRQLLTSSGKPLGDATRDALIAMREFGGSTLPLDDVTLVGLEFV